ncbi:hypothetical protein CRENBAI_002195 [Crenichthys baileyi]|uniref:DAN domain-containing protein n=1 Tax=Crenichthys baileyi TaxID=28760 RepID=A0AAV9RNK0_9TELE
MMSAGAAMWQGIQICYALFALHSAAAPAHINRLALFPDKSAWCEAKNITQIVGHTGCQPRSIHNSSCLHRRERFGRLKHIMSVRQARSHSLSSSLYRACLGQCFSYSVPNTFPQSTESLAHCDSCMPAQTQWEVVTLECPSSEDSPRVDKLVEKILHCSCQSCSKENAQDGAVMQLYPADNTLDLAPSVSDPLIVDPSHSLPHSDTLSDKQARPHADQHHTLPHTSDGG